MKISLFATLTIAALLCGCGKPSSPTGPSKVRWEYQTVVVNNYDNHMIDVAFVEMGTNRNLGLQHWRVAQSGPGGFGPIDSEIEIKGYTANFANLGYDGWELVSAVPQLETIPTAEYDDGSGVKKFTNVRTGKILLFFKRQK